MGAESWVIGEYHGMDKDARNMRGWRWRRESRGWKRRFNSIKGEKGMLVRLEVSVRDRGTDLGTYRLVLVLAKRYSPVANETLFPYGMRPLL
ncbi:hypothetical protein L1987_08665 [Smallanthus sonchifolius]|uniref:Uncharacterized protein n=1 Tax=Smallanthus sonchifolius TaxID=185202 RepID=A0ACB9JKT2_9ASTR|nr:hypothetical protein L1987_08665 [Smallanthus sonchifolius]